MRTVQIPGGTATLREPSEMTERQRRSVRNVMFDALGALGIDSITPGIDPESIHVDAGAGDVLFRLRDAAIAASLVSWTLDVPLPTVDQIQDLPGDVYDALASATSGVSAGLSVNFDPTPDAESPTQPSSSSDGPLRGEEVLTPAQLTGGASTSTASSTT